MKHGSDTPLLKAPQSSATVTPPADIYESDDAYVLMLDMPGATKESISISMEGRQLKVRGTVDTTREEGARVLRNEIRGGVYERVFNLTDSIDRNSVDAHYADGVVTIKLLKTEESKTRTIPIR